MAKLEHEVRDPQALALKRSGVHDARGAKIVRKRPEERKVEESDLGTERNLQVAE